MAGVSPARKAAFDILLTVERGHGHSDDLLRGKRVNALSAPDRNLATALVLGVLRWQISLDRQICSLLKRPNAKLDPEVLIALRLGAFQLLHLDRIPAHAAIDESVELAKRAGQRYASGMVNAVLRELARRGQGIACAEGVATRRQGEAGPSTAPFAKDANGSAQDDRVLCSQQSISPAEEAYPAWMIERWLRNYGAEAASAICVHGQMQPKLSLRIADPRAEAELTDAGIQFAPGELLTAARVVLAGDVAATAAFREGRVRIQDEGSQLVAEIAAFSAKVPVQDNGRILDACAAPGGKTLVLAERLPEAHIIACEASPQRLAQLKDRLSAYEDRVECRLADAAALQIEPTFDLAIADVPCSGTGTLGRNPEIRHRLNAADLPRQAERQHAILRSVLGAVRPRGRVIYSTCSLEPEENEEVVAAVLAEKGTARQISLAPQIEQMERAGILTEGAAKHLASCLTPEGALRLIPGALGTDGFFVALLERIA